MSYTPGYGDIVFTLQQLWVATLAANNSYGIPAQIGYAQDFDFSPEHDEDMIKAGGANVEALKVLIGGSIKISEAAMAYAAYAIITGDSASTSGTSGNLITTMDNEAGGDGTPYVGVAAVFAATHGARFVFGAPKCMATKPSFKAAQNTFRTGELNLSVLTPKAPPAALYRPRKYENVADVPDFSLAADWDSYFAGMFG